MLSRRQFSAALAGALCCPPVVQAQALPIDTLRDAALGLPQLHAILVQRGDERLLAEAPRGRGLEAAANIKSCSKSLLALILGTAIARGEIVGLSARLGEVAPQLIPGDATEGVADLTMADLVTLRAGLEGTSGAKYGTWVNSRNWIAYALRQSRIAPNGGRMIYSTGTTHVLGAAIAVATGKDLRQLARERLGRPLGIDVASWTRDPQGYYFGGNEMALTPEAMLRVAVMLRDGGSYGGTQVVDQEWVEASRVPQTTSPYSGLDYGLGWFLSTTGWVIARGYGGQIIAAHSERALAVAITSDPTQIARSGGYFGDLMRLLDGPILGLS
ncbi:serine hydrolase domain-containing protein [Pseudotabrizicola alkalilacus]|uniref:Class C beta-lactamase-related serine hydrolase n=1 Tax=Pseudotabrizicola alkalilacus TaxID=2305252 RepID=A0A411Z732_9RHOB|nr:serine hydrolase [Pseudotabrizicola alkalilacus]RGP38881.1 class C beta-lactamase-related serine hydrolase [Pseudotabrizicola alkalilacus]